MIRRPGGFQTSFPMSQHTKDGSGVLSAQPGPPPAKPPLLMAQHLQRSRSLCQALCSPPNREVPAHWTLGVTPRGSVLPVGGGRSGGG